MTRSSQSAADMKSEEVAFHCRKHSMSSPVLELWRMIRLISNLKLHGKISKMCHLGEALLNYFCMIRLNDLLSSVFSSVQCISQAFRVLAIAFSAGRGQGG